MSESQVIKMKLALNYNAEFWGQMRLSNEVDRRLASERRLEYDLHSRPVIFSLI